MRCIVFICFVANNTLLMRYCDYAFVWRNEIASPERSESDFKNMKTNLVIEWYKNYWTRLSQNIAIYQCLVDQSRQ